MNYLWIILNYGAISVFKIYSLVINSYYRTINFWIKGDLEFLHEIRFILVIFLFIWQNGFPVFRKIYSMGENLNNFSIKFNMKIIQKYWFNSIFTLISLDGTKTFHNSSFTPKKCWNTSQIEFPKQNKTPQRKLNFKSVSLSIHLNILPQKLSHCSAIC